MPFTLKDLEKVSEELMKSRKEFSSLVKPITLLPNQLLQGKKIAITVKGSNKFHVSPEVISANQETFQSLIKEIRVIELESIEQFTPSMPIQEYYPALLRFQQITKS